MNDSKAYCDNPSTHSMCYFENSICYDTIEKTWETLLYPFPKWDGSVILSHGLDDLTNHGCHHPFKPNLNTNISLLSFQQDTFWFPYPTVKLCIWNTHIGHVFLEQLLPTFLLLRRYSLHQSSKIILLLNYQYFTNWGSNETLYSVIGSLSPHAEVIMLHHFLSESHTKTNKRYICFQQFLFGTKNTAPTFYKESNSIDLYPNEIQSFRDYIFISNSLPIVSFNKSEIIFIFEQRTNGRLIVNLDEMIASIHKLIHKNKPIIKIVSFTKMKFLEQITSVANSNILVTVAGTASHHLMWLRNGGISIEIIHPTRKQDVNKYLRNKINYITTIILNETIIDGTIPSSSRDPSNGDVKVNILEWENALKTFNDRKLF